MQLTPKPVTAQWHGASDNRSVLRILDYVAEVRLLKDGRYRWQVERVHSNTANVELDWGITVMGLMAARDIAENVILRDHHEGGGA